MHYLKECNITLFEHANQYQYIMYYKALRKQVNINIISKLSNLHAFVAFSSKK